jgi:hypothetical protein
MKRGRKSTAELSVVVPFNEGRCRIDPPAARAMIFNELTLSVPAGHFVPSDIPLLAAYAGALALNRGALRALYRKPDRTVLMVWEPEGRRPKALHAWSTSLQRYPSACRP